MKFLPVRILPRRMLLATLAVSAALLAVPTPAADLPAGLAGSGAALVPADAAFFSATLRVREQYDRFMKSNAWAALRGIPAVKRALDSFEEQRTMPGNPLSMVDAFLQLPENAQAAELLADLVATDTFVYGEPSCAAFMKLARRLSAAAQAAGAMGADGGWIIEEEMDIFPDEDDDGGEAAAPAAARGPRFQIQFGDDAVATSPASAGKRLVIETLIDNLDLLVMPDVVWGFRTTMPEAAKAQLGRLEVLARMATEQNPDLAQAIVRAKVGGGDFLVFTVRGASLPWDEIEPALRDEADDLDGFEDLLATLRRLDICVALGVVGDRVILSFGDSTDHLVKLAAAAGKRLLDQPSLAPLLALHDRPLTGIGHLSTEMVGAIADSPDDLERQLDVLEQGLGIAGMPVEAIAACRTVVERFAAAMAARMPEPGAWTSCAWMADSGYEGRVWNRSRNQPVDGSRRLDLVEHAGGAPLAVVVSRLKSDPRLVGDLSDFAGGLWSLVEEHALPALGEEERDKAEAFADRLETLAGRLAELLRDKLLASLADGQVGLVFDDKSRTKKPHADLPASAEALPLPELAIVLPLKDAKLFREGLSDLFALGDDAVAALREIDPDAVPRDSLLPDPEKAKVAGGTVWSFPLPESGLDEQVRPAIGVGDQVAVFALAPKQAGRLLSAARIETGAPLPTCEEPLAAAAAADVAGIVDALRPWIVYLTRYGCARERDGDVEADAELRAADETEQARDALQAVDVVLEVAKCLRAAVSETAVRDGVLVTSWRNTIRDLPQKP
ncbi:MAG: hypothetical protein ACKOSQ_02570 [Planctomycetaceae bacterium]